MKVPWAYIRRMIARDWFVPPWVLDGSDEPPDMANEVNIELRIRQIEAAVERWNP
jgi:hypothetical protein